MSALIAEATDVDGLAIALLKSWALVSDGSAQEKRTWSAAVWTRHQDLGISNDSIWNAALQDWFTQISYDDQAVLGLRRSSSRLSGR